MSKVNSDLLKKMQLLVVGLRKNYNLVKDKGLDESFIAKMETVGEVALKFNNENEKLRMELKLKVKNIKSDKF